MQIRTLQEFYRLMMDTKPVKQEIAANYLENISISASLIEKLEQFLHILQNTEKEGENYVLAIPDGKKAPVNMDYEINELQKDIYFLKNGEDAFVKHLREIHPEFEEEVNKGIHQLKNIPFRNFITDRDGTINNYCARYVTSIQSVYNAVFLTRFVKHNNIEIPVILTSAPLINTGLADISVNPDGIFIYAGSKGREYLDKARERNSFPVEREKQEILDEFNEEIFKILKHPEYIVFSYIGSGLQLKFGQTTIARQDVNNVIPEDKSLAFLKTIEQLVAKLDPNQRFFRIEDTGKDIEVILTIEEGDSGSLKDFDKGDAVKFLNSELNLNIAGGPNLICGDTGSDVPMVTASMKETNDTYALFATQDENLKEKVRNACPNTVFVSGPDMLISILDNLKK